MSQHAPATGSIWKQPMTVWAIAFASVVSFMGIGLVDPILPAIAKELEASPAETELLFTSYLLITGAAMLFTSWVSTRIGTKRTLLLGLGVIVVFSLLCSASGGADWIIGFRAGWGLGNALFISTALAAIVGAATGGTGAAIVLYESALGLGIAIGPLIGGLLGSWTWRAPFAGVAVLMAIGFILIVTLLRSPKGAERPVPTKLSAPFAALARVPALRTLAIVAIFYNFGFFTLLAWAPFVLPTEFGAMGLGFVFFGWGIALAVASIWGAPALTSRFRRTSVLIWTFAVLALVLALCGVFELLGWTIGLIVAIIAGGLPLGVLNTALTETVMEATDLPRQVASGAYSAVRFVGGAIAPPVSAAIASGLGTAILGDQVQGMDPALASHAADVAGGWLPFFVGAAALVISGILTLATRNGMLRRVDELGTAPAAEVEAEAIAIGDVD